MHETQSPGEPSPYAHLTPEFLERLDRVMDGLDPIGVWRATYSGLVPQCLLAIDPFIGRIKNYLSDEHQSLVTDALFVSFKAHKLALRKSGDALFFEHPLATADFLASYLLDAATLAAALLHDVAEDTTLSMPRIVELFGPDVGKLVDGVTKLQATGKAVTSQLQQEAIRIESINKLFRFMVDDVRVMLVKLADRLHNMQTLTALPREKQREKAYEVLEVYAPLAYRLGMWDVMSELEEIALKTLQPDSYQKLKLLMDRRAAKQQPRFDLTQDLLIQNLAAAGIKAEIELSREQIYSVYQQLERQGRALPRLTDTLRVAVVVNSRCLCYQALCAVHESWTPVPGTFDDYIANPRENLYQSLHTTVFGPGGMLKIRVRTEEMHQIAHHGILARWLSELTETAKGLEEQVDDIFRRLAPLEGIAERGDRLTAYREALTDQIQVFTPKGKPIELPSGSTPLDFAYAIHSKLGDEARSARINGVPRPLNTALRNGDTVTVARYRGEQPLRIWLDEDLGFIRTAYARSRIRRSFRQLTGADAVSVGWEVLQREMRMMGQEEYDLEDIARALEYDGSEGLLVAIARADVMPHQVTHLAIKPVWESLEALSLGGVVASPDGPVNVRGVPGRQVKLCGTCQPTPGDSIIGNLLRGGQVTVHQMDCHHIAHTSQQASQLNLVEVEWAEKSHLVRAVHVCVAAVDRSGLTHDLTQILEQEHVNICEMYGRADHVHHVGLVSLTIEVAGLRQLSRILHRIAQLPNVKVVRRVSESPHGQEAIMRWAVDCVHGKVDCS